MKQYARSYLLAACCTFCFSYVNAQHPEFEKINAVDAPATVHNISQDSTGFLWLGTDYGLLRYDGKAFKTYLPGIVVRSVLPGSDGLIWVGTERDGLHLFDSRQQVTTTKYNHNSAHPNTLSKGAILKLAAAPNGDLWIIKSDGVGRIALKTGDLTFFPKDSLHADLQSPVIAFQSPNEVWLGRHLFQSPELLHINQIDLTAGVDSTENPIHDIWIDKTSSVWLGTNRGLAKLDDRSGQITWLNTGNSNLSFDVVRKIFQRDAHTLWLGTERGLNILDLSTNEVTAFLEDQEDPNSISGNEINDIFQDAGGILWIGTRGGGLNKVARKSIPFENYSSENGLTEQVTLAFLEDQQQKLWVGTFGGGLNIFERTGNQYSLTKTFLQNQKNSINDNYITALTEDREGRVWIGTRRGGINVFDPSTEQFNSYVSDEDNNESLSNNFILSLHVDHKGSIWIGTNGGGLNRFDVQNQKFARIEHIEGDSSSLSSNAVTTIFEDAKGRLWVGTNTGLNLLDGEKVIANRYLDSVAVMTIFEDKEGALWIGTENNGLLEFHPEQGSITRYGKQQGLPFNTVFGILSDNQGFLWLNNAGAITRFDPATKQFRPYDKNDGLDNSDFNQLAFHKGKHSGFLFFGNVEGFVSFKPDVKRNAYIPPVAFTSFYVFDQERSFNGKKVTLAPEENVFSVDFAALDYTQPEKNQYRYQLVGFNESWLTDIGNQKATYTNLDPGTYHLRVIGANNDGLWNHTGVSMEVVVKPKLLETWWFRLASALLLLGITVQFLLQRKRKKQEIAAAREAERESLALAIHDGPLQALIGTRFLTRTLSETTQNPDYKLQISELEKTLEQVRNELRTVEEELEPNLEDGLAAAIETHVELLQTAHPSFNIETRLSLAPNSIPVNLRKDMYRIYRTTILNVIKYAQQASIKIDLTRSNKYVYLSISDNGPGFDVPDELPKGHALYFSKKLAQALNGTFLIESNLNRGTQVIVNLPLKRWLI